MIRRPVMASLMLVAALTGTAVPVDGAGKPTQTPQDSPDVLIADFEGKSAAVPPAGRRRSGRSLSTN